MAGGTKTPAKGTGQSSPPAKQAVRASAEPTGFFATTSQRLATHKALSEKAGDINEIRAALIAEAGMGRGLWITFLSLGTYLVIAVGAITHRDLFLENPVKLPLLNVDLPLVAFFWVAPLLFLVFHAYLLLHLKLLGDKIRRYSDVVAGAGLSAQEEDSVRLQLPNFVFVQLLAAPKDARRGLVAWLLRVIAWITVVIGPLVLLLLIQLQFLPYQSAGTTWVHRVALIVDVALLWLFWPRVLMAPNGKGAARWRPWHILGSATIIVAGGFSWVLATIPDEFADRLMTATLQSRSNDKDDESIWVDELFIDPAKKWLFQGEVNEVTGKRMSMFSNTLVLPDQDFIDDELLAEIEERERKSVKNPWNGERTIGLRGRNLRGAVLVRADLRRADFTGANLQGASLEEARLQGAAFRCAATGNQVDADPVSDNEGCARLHGASLLGTHLQGASLDNANLQGAVFFGARLQGASLINARLQGAMLDIANLQGASLQGASLQGASLLGARLQGASLKAARLQGASLRAARLQGASLIEANLQGASLVEANLQGAWLVVADLQGASLDNARLQGASLNGTFLWRAYGKPFPGDPVRVWVWEPNLSKLTTEQIAEREKEALLGVESENVKERIKRALALLSAPESKLQDRLPANYWQDLSARWNEADHRKELADRLKVLACGADDAPYIARGLISNGFSERIDTALLPHVARTLLNAAEGKTNDCPGAKGLDAAAMALLRTWATEVDEGK